MLYEVITWFDVRVEQALNDALELSRSSLESRMRELLRQTNALVGQINLSGGTSTAVTIDDLRNDAGAAELTLLGQNGRIIATSSQETLQLVPNRPDDAILLQVHQGHTYVGLDPIEGAGLYVRVVVGLEPTEPGVITSYSIHYTKLYDSGGARSARSCPPLMLSVHQGLGGEGMICGSLPLTSNARASRAWA